MVISCGHESEERVFFMRETTSAKLSIAAAAFIFGTIGAFSRMVTMPTAVTTMCRGLIAGPLLLLVLRLQGKRLDREAIARHFWELVLSGLLLATAMITLFEAYRYLSVAVATMFYHMAPVFFVALAPLFFGERMTNRKILCIATAVFGVMLVSGILETGLPKTLQEAKGMLFGLACALSYTVVLIINKKTTDVPALDKTIVQILAFGLVLLPVNLLSGAFSQVILSPASIFATLVMAVFHTAIGYRLYFGALEQLPANTAAIFTYTEPVTAVLMSAFVLREPMTPLNALGILLVLGAAVCNELPSKKLRLHPQTGS